MTVEAQAVDDGKWAIRVATLSGAMAGERQLKTDSCEEARRAVALLVVLMLYPQANIAGSATPKTRSESEAPPVKPAPSAIAQPEHQAPARRVNEPTPFDSRASRRPLRAAFGAHLLADNGTLPSVDVGARVLVGMKADNWELALRGSGWASRNKDYAGASGMGVNLGLYEAELAGCGNMVRQGEAAFQLCAGPRVYAFRASSYGVASPNSVTELAWGAFGELALIYSVAQGAALRLAFDALVPFERPKFAIYDVGFVFQQRSIAERLSLGPEFEF